MHKSVSGESKAAPASQANADRSKPVSKGRHEYQCTICSHKQREEIELAFVNWVSPARIAKQFSVSRDSIYRHAHALDLTRKRRQNVRAALERIIEKADEVKVNAAAVVSAVGALARINSRGEWVERTETVSLDAMFERMTPTELEQYAKDGTLPTWFPAAGATDDDSQEAANGE